MDAKHAIQGVPRLLREMLEKRRPEYEALIRRTRWGDGPLFIVGRGASLLAGMSAGLGFESLVGWPAVVREATEFSAYAMGVLRPRSLVLAISHSGETPETLEAARAAHARGAIVLALTSEPQSALAALADGIFLVGGETGRGSPSETCRHAALGYISLMTAQVLKRHHPQLAALEAEFQKLPYHIEWMLTQLGDAVRPFAAELRNCKSLTVMGGGFFHPIAAAWARQLRERLRIGVECAPPFEDELDTLRGSEAAHGLAIVSNSRCRLKRAVDKAAARAERAGIKRLTITDRDDRELQKRSAFAILLPGLREMTGATLALGLLEWVTCHVAAEHVSDRPPSRSRPRGK